MNLQTKYLGLTLKNPLIVSSCRLSEKIENIKQMEKAGAAAVVMYSIFEEEVRYDDSFVDYFMHCKTESFAESLTYFPNIDAQATFLDQHLLHLKNAVKAVNIPIIGSLNAISHEGWLDYALKMQDTGISALELNLYYPPSASQSSAEIEQKYLVTTTELKKKLRIPLVVKLSPFFTSINDIASKLAKQAKVDGLVLFNRFYSPDIDLNNLNVISNVVLSTSYEMRFPMRWIMLLRDQLQCSIGASTGAHTADDVIKYLLVGADAVMCASCLMKNGINHLTILLDGLTKWMQNNNYASVDKIRGLVNKNIEVDKEAFERAQYMKALRSYKNEYLKD